MLDLTVAMMQILLTFALFFHAVQDAPAAITSPRSGDILRGQINILGYMDVPNFVSAELAFAYASNLTGTWFTIQTYAQPVTDSALAVWDTTRLTDGDYLLRLRVFLADGTFQEALVSDLKIQNDSPVPPELPATFTPAPIELPPPTSTVLPATATLAFPTPTPLSPNPATLAASSIYSTFGRGALIAVITFAVAALFLRLRRS